MGGRMDSPHIPLTGSPWFRPLWAEVGHGAGDKPLFVGTSAKRRGVAASDDRWLAGWLVGHRRWNLHVCSVRCRASTSLSISGCIAIDAHLGSDEASSVILFSSQMLPVNPAATHTHTLLPTQTARCIKGSHCGAFTSSTGRRRRRQKQPR